MELNSVKIHQNYEKILENVKKYSPYPEKVKILFVSKYLNVEEHKAVIDMGYDYFGENRAQLYRDKLNEFSDEKYKNIKWDFIGRLQKNKIKYIINSVNLVHSIDSYQLLEEINKKAIENNKTISGLIQINVSREESKTGVYIEDFKKDSEKYFSMSNVKIAGFMTMAPFDASEYEIDNYFSKMRELKEEYEKKYDYITELSMGMSNDYIEALKNGATIIRIGSKLFE
ncbi:YggS family pyridoxal phosphate-dependent enzyme [Leptotrichia buccalis]|jgi:pyridoxal phosphate enzyme, yggS family|uniref:Pyridoxal phosphate homeostasis protein n=1 Tax=Leptotrichia buccalis (strain ATCC 14201 / DSM 1135 / JCM 12969 / NCTC 10249 / C-1013-b) TaxID=523794 RepID=C7ND72_LEPBD|nr:YggS family pyridoxal phosphate-dependent enzyme [Leptotrichia buccalis]ACV39950.1 alanine racemase domain protein [Leptotrichia buccalis C-1013-b]